MRVVIQRVLRASVSIHQKVHASIGRGLLVLCGFEDLDTEEDIEWMAKKISGLRIFSDDGGTMNFSVVDIHGQIMIVSQFTLYAQTKKGQRPSFVKAAKPDTAIPLYQSFLKNCQEHVTSEIASGVFGAAMQIELLNDGPVTIIIDSKNRS